MKQYDLVVIIILSVILVSASFLSGHSWAATHNPTSEPKEAQNGSQEVSLAFISSVDSPLETPEQFILASLTDDPDEFELATKIIWCESSWDKNAKNRKYGPHAGMGLFQLIPTTVKYCEEKLGHQIDPYDPNDNLRCGMWLLQNEGSYHWGTPTSNWGSYWCWSS